MTCARATVPEAAPVLGISPGELRKQLRQGKLEYGEAIVVKVLPDGTKRFRYNLWIPKILEHTGLKEWPGRKDV